MDTELKQIHFCLCLMMLADDSIKFNWDIFFCSNCVFVAANTVIVIVVVEKQTKRKNGCSNGNFA